MRLHFAAAILVCALGIYFRLTSLEWLLVAACIVLVMVCELFNTAVERICDLITTEIHPAVKYIKDIAAAAVLLSSILALITGIVVFGGHLGLFNH